MSGKGKRSRVGPVGEEEKPCDEETPVVRLDEQALSASSTATDEETKQDLSGGVTSFPIRTETKGVPFIKTGFATVTRVRRSTSIPTPMPKDVISSSTTLSDCGDEEAGGEALGEGGWEDEEGEWDEDDQPLP